MTRTELARTIYERAHLTGSFVLRSGAVADRYFDKFLLAADPRVLREICEAMAPLVPAGADALAGIQLGGVPLAAVLSQVTSLPTRYVRLAPKAYATRRLAEGGEVSGVRLVLVEDVVTTGGQLVQSCGALRELGAIVEHAVCVVDREQDGERNLRSAGVELRSLYRMSELDPS